MRWWKYERCARYCFLCTQQALSHDVWSFRGDVTACDGVVLYPFLTTKKKQSYQRVHMRVTTRFDDYVEFRPHFQAGFLTE